MSEDCIDALSAACQPGLQLAVYGVERGCKAEEQSCQHCDSGREQQGGQVQRDRGFAGKSIVGWDRGDHPFQTPKGKNTASDASGCCQHKAFYQKLADQPAPARAQRRTDTDLLLSRGRTSEQQIRDVAARNEEQHSDRTKQDVERALEVANHITRQCVGPNVEALWIVFRINLGETVSNDVQVRRRSLQADTWSTAFLSNDKLRLVAWIIVAEGRAAQRER